MGYPRAASAPRPARGRTTAPSVHRAGAGSTPRAPGGVPGRLDKTTARVFRRFPPPHGRHLHGDAPSHRFAVHAAKRVASLPSSGTAEGSARTARRREAPRARAGRSQWRRGWTRAGSARGGGRGLSGCGRALPAVRRRRPAAKAPGPALSPPAFALRRSRGVPRSQLLVSSAVTT